ncbi:insulin-degrading enzyme isoform X2 [Venturia canescens]|uniref:insulin-degrading enzyme isoform X2 n=1 Tax=Venturia canescens TaxID=32260 RepID=UPI001C9C6548|nr:insulin-degrading enzyme isoform X2 [Venturia canescens]
MLTGRFFRCRILFVPENFFRRQVSDAKTMLSSPQPQDGVKKRFENITKSKNDDRNYRGLVLSNNMKVLLISDPTDKSAASMDVNIGFMSDPPDLPGLAHFCEHMLFLGTEKYPDKDEYNTFLSQHGGQSNAATHMDYTNYHVEVTPDELDSVLDRFSQFFLNPLFTESATELEVNAVNSEHEKNIANDVWRADQLEKSSADPNHPYSKFGSGNRETLDVIPKAKGIDVRKALLDFHKTWYSANIMALSVLGKESLDELEEMVVSRFAHVEDKNVEAPAWPEHPYKQEHFKNKWSVVPIKDIRYLNMSFPLPDMHEHFRSAPAHYVSHLLGHEGNGSLLAALRKAGWSDSLMAGERTAARGDCNFFNVIVDLTEEGIKHVDDIITLLFQYINMLKEAGPLEWIYDEYKQISMMEFDFKEKLRPGSYVNVMSRALQKYPMEEILIAPYLLTEWRPDLINTVIDHLTPDNIRVYVIGKIFEDIATETEPWYGTKFKKESIASETIEKWQNCGLNEDLVFPTKNEFIPEDFAIRAHDVARSAIEKFPVIIEDSPFTRIWFKQDDEFLLPKVNLTFDFTSPLAYMDPVSCNLTYMYIQLVKDSLNEYAYDAGLAGLTWEFSGSKYGITMTIGGYHDKHRILLEKIMDKMVNFTIDSKRFEILKGNHIRSLKNLEAEQPYKHAIYYLAVLLAEQVWKRGDLLNASEHITEQKLREFVPQLLTKMHVECLVHGNLTKAEALETVQLVQSKLKEPARENDDRRIVPLLSRQLLLYREISLDNGCHYLYQAENSHHKSSCTEVYYQTGLQSTESNMHLELLAQIISQPCFSTLRTSEQLGYIVVSGIRRANGVQGLRIIVQSDRHPKYVDDRIELFMESMLEQITKMGEDEFNRHKAALAAQRLEKPRMMGTLSAVFWSEIATQQYNFDRTTIEVAYLKTITKDQILQFFKEVIHAKAPMRRKLAVHILSMADGGAGLVEYTGTKNDETTEGVVQEVPIEIKDIISFKASQSLYPLVKPFNGIARKGQRSKL